jgi:AraC-like DNA-binding protein
MLTGVSQETARTNVIAKVSFDTRSVAARDRIDFWEEQCSQDVVGLTCSSLEHGGFQARYSFVQLDGLKIIDIAGKQHVVERTPNLVRARQKDAVFLTLLMHGTAFVNRANECVTLNEGDCVLYDTDCAYMHGFPATMRHVIFEVPGEEFRTRFPGWQLRAALKYQPFGPGRVIATALRQVLDRHDPFNQSSVDSAIVDDVWQVLSEARSLLTGSGRSTYHVLMIARIRKFISENLGNPGLAPEMIAKEAGISVRQLNRLFSAEKQTVSGNILAMRLERCRQDLMSCGDSGTTVSEIAYHWGFCNLAHFSRRFRERFGCSPSEMRRRQAKAVVG